MARRSGRSDAGKPERTTADHWLPREIPRAGGKTRRGYDGKITNCFPGSRSENREQRDAWQITQLAHQADLVLDIHGTMKKGWDFPFYGTAGRSSPLIIGVASLLGCERV